MARRPVAVNDPAAFHRAVSNAKRKLEYGPSVELKNVEDYGPTQMYLSPDSKAGFAVKPDGDLVSVFSTGRGRLPAIMSAADRAGAGMLDAFDIRQAGSKQGLPAMYGQYGWKETGRMPWDPQYAPPDWRPELGTPDVVFMRKALQQRMEEQNALQ